MRGARSWLSARKRTVSAVASKARRHLARLDERREARQPGQPGRRLREAADRFDDAIEFESPEGAGVHER